MRKALFVALIVGARVNVPAATAVAAPTAPAFAPATCDLVAAAARAHGLPVGFFTRLIWRESAFRGGAVSPAGARGIAQFMPATAAGRGLADPFRSADALQHAAALLADLRAAFGNLGLAAAAYNAGSGRVARWLAGEAALPAETTAYVRAVSGREADAWRGAGDAPPAADAGFSCPRYAAAARTAPAAPASDGPAKPWAVILVGALQRPQALAAYQTVRARFSAILRGVEPTVVHRRISGTRTPRYIVQIERDTRAGADAFCGRLLRAGGACFVLVSGS